MNEIICKNTKKEEVINLGDLFKDGSGRVYILCRPTALKFCSIRLNDGVRWSDPCETMQDAIIGLTFYKSGAKIIIE